MASYIHPHSLIDNSLHSAALLELLDMNKKYNRNFIEYVVDCVTETVRIALECTTSAARGRSPSRHLGRDSTTKFIQRVLYMSDTRVPVLLVALVYIQRAKTDIRISQEMWAYERVFLGALICAHKYVNDTTFKNHHWSTCTGIFSSRDVSRAEREFLEVLDFQLGFNESDVLVHYAPIMASSASQNLYPAHPLVSVDEQLPLSSRWSPDSSDEESDTDSSYSSESSSPPSTPPDADMDASNSYVNISGRLHSPAPIPTSPSLIQGKWTEHQSHAWKMCHHPLSTALRLINAFPPIHRVTSHHAQPVKITPGPRILETSSAPPFDSCPPSSFSPVSSAFEPILKSHHDILMVARFETAFY